MAVITPKSNPKFEISRIDRMWNHLLRKISERGCFQMNPCINSMTAKSLSVDLGRSPASPNIWQFALVTWVRRNLLVTNLKKLWFGVQLKRKLLTLCQWLSYW